MANPIRIQKFGDTIRHVNGYSKLPARNLEAHAALLNKQLTNAVSEINRKTKQRSQDLPPLPDAVQLAVKINTNSKGKPSLDSSALKQLGLQPVEERRNGIVITLAADKELRKLEQAIEDFRIDAHTKPTDKTPNGKRKRGVNTIYSIDELQITPRDLRIGDLLAAIPIEDTRNYIVDIEIGVGNATDSVSEEQRNKFRQYIRDGKGVFIDQGLFYEEDYSYCRVTIDGRLLNDLIDNHPLVKYVDLPPVVEQEGMILRQMKKSALPKIVPPLPTASKICIIDSGVVIQHPLLIAATKGRYHDSYIPNDGTIGDVGEYGHGTAVASIAALGELRKLLNQVNTPIQPVPLIIAKVLDENALLPTSVNVKKVLPEIVKNLKQKTGVLIFNHSITAVTQFRKDRMSIWGETIDRIVYDDGNEGCLFIVCTGNTDIERPNATITKKNLHKLGHPKFLLKDEYRLRNLSQAINALTVGAYSVTETPSFAARSRGNSSIALQYEPSPITRTGFGFLGEVKPEVVEEGGKLYKQGGGLSFIGDSTDVVVAAHDFLLGSHLIKFTTGTSFAAPKVANLAAKIQDNLSTNNADLVRAVVINSAAWPIRLNSISIEEQLRLFGYGVPDPVRALEIGGSRCIILIEDKIRIGNVQFFRIPWPTELFEQLPDLQIRVSITLSYRSPVRKTNQKYRGTILEWRLSKRGESLQDFNNRCVYQGKAAPVDEIDEDDVVENAVIGDWPWLVKTDLRKRGTAQKDWFEAPASYFGQELYLSVIGRRGWLSKKQQEEGWDQKYAIAICIEVIGQNIPIHERIAQLVQIPVQDQIKVRT